MGVETLIIAGSILAAGAASAISSKQSRDKAESASRMQREREDLAKKELIQEKEQSDERAKAEAKRRRVGAARSSTVRTSPLGIGGQADIAQKTLLGN